jgi:hypothetical protein
MRRVAQLLLSPKYHGVITAITRATNTDDIELKTFVHAQEQSAQGITVFQGLDAWESFVPDSEQSTPIDLWKAQYNAILKMKAKDVSYMRTHSIATWKPEHILTARRLVSALCLIKYYYPIGNASQWEIVSRFIKLLNFLDLQHFQNLAAEARAFNPPEAESVGSRSSLAVIHTKQITGSALALVEHRGGAARNMQASHKGVFAILWGKLFGR